MAFVIKKNIHGRDYYYLNENKRVSGKVKTKTIAYLGKSKKEAEMRAREIIGNRGKREPSNEIKEKTKEKDISKEAPTPISIDELATFCKRKGFVYPSSEIYGGLSGFWDFGPLGVELLNNIKKEWWDYF